MANVVVWNKRKMEMRKALQDAGKWKEFVRLRGTLQATGIPVRESYEQAFASIMEGKSKDETAFAWGKDT